jgi:armadillo repeat-containing protein 8
MRKNALWAIKNLLCKSTLELKKKTMFHIGWKSLIEYDSETFYIFRRFLTKCGSLLQNPNVMIQEQAWNIVCNLAENEEGVELVMQEMGADVLFHSLLAGLGSSEENVVFQVRPFPF